MPKRRPQRVVQLPRGWTRIARSAVLQAVSLAHLAISHARGWAANSSNARVRQAAEIERLHAEVAMLREELRIKDARMMAIMPHRRPYYPPAMRMAILELKAARHAGGRERPKESAT